MSRRGKGEGSIRLRKDGRWEGTLQLTPRGGKRQRRSFFGKTQAEALRKLRDAQNKLDRNEVLVPARLTLASHLATWLVEKKKTLRAESWRRYDDLCRLYIVPAIGNVRLAKLEIADVQALH